MHGACVGRRIRAVITIIAAHVTIVVISIVRSSVRVIHAVSSRWLRRRLINDPVHTGGRPWVVRKVVFLYLFVRHGIGGMAAIVHCTTVVLPAVRSAGRRLNREIPRVHGLSGGLPVSSRLSAPLFLCNRVTASKTTSHRRMGRMSKEKDGPLTGIYSPLTS